MGAGTGIGTGTDAGDAPEPVLPRVAAGDPGAAEECMTRYRGLIWSIVRKTLKVGADADDAVQEVFISLWRSAARFDPSKGSEITFVGTIARRRVVDRLRRKTARPETEQVPDEVLEADLPPVSQALEIEEAAGRARRALDRLPEQRRRVLEMAVLEGETHVSIAETTGIPLGTVKTHVRRGLMRLREMLGEPAGGDDG